MLNIFSNKQKWVYDIILFTTHLKPPIIKSYDEINENTRYYPFASKEWSTNIYSYNKSYTKSLISLNAILNKLVKSYCNILQNKIKILFKRRRANKMRYSADKVYISGIELSHTNSNIFITLSLFNKRKYSIEQSIRKAITLIKFHKIIVRVGDENKTIYIANHKNRLLHFFKNNFCIFKKWNIAFFKPIGNVVKYFTVNIGQKHLESHNILTNNIKLLNKFITSQINLFTSTKEINFSISKHNTLYIKWKGLGLISLIEKLFNKNVEIELIELKNIHLNSAVFSSAVALKLRDRKNKAVRILRKAILQMVRIPDLHTLITFDDNIEEMNKNNIINTIKQQIVTGVRLEASGRLTRRLTAMRAVFKYRYAGSLKNIRSSFNNISSTMLRGYVKSNSQYTLINSKTRNGTFGLKGWVSSHSGIIEKWNLSPFNHYLGFVKGKAIFGYLWAVPQLFSYCLRILKDKCAPGLEWALSNPPKPHAFTNIPLESSNGTGSVQGSGSAEPKWESTSTFSHHFMPSFSLNMDYTITQKLNHLKLLADQFPVGSSDRIRAINRINYIIRQEQLNQINGMPMDWRLTMLDKTIEDCKVGTLSLAATPNTNNNGNTQGNYLLPVVTPAFRVHLYQFIKNILSYLVPLFTIIIPLLSIVLSIFYLSYFSEVYTMLVSIFNEYILLTISMLLSVVYFLIKLLCIIRRANNSTGLYDRWFKFATDHRSSIIIYNLILLLSIGLLLYCGDFSSSEQYICDGSRAWELCFQDSASPQTQGLVEHIVAAILDCVHYSVSTLLYALDFAVISCDASGAWESYLYIQDSDSIKGISIATTALFLHIVYLQLVKGKAIFGYLWAVPPLFSDCLRILKDKCAPGLEWALSNPPKPHAFTSLPLNSGLDKGKGRAKFSPEVEKIPSPSPYYDSDSDYEKNIRLALDASLKPPKIGEPSSSKVPQKETYLESTYNHSEVEAKVQLYKYFKDEFLRYSRLHFNLKIKLVKEPTTKEKDSLFYYWEKANFFKEKKTAVEQELLKQGINPSAQFNSDSSSPRGSSPEYESESSQDRSKKRVKYSNDKNIDSSLGFILFNITPVLRLLSCVFSAIFFVMCLILPDLDLSFFKIDLSQLLFTYLMFTVTKLIYKSYRVLASLYNHFLNKDYIIIYFNVYFSIVTILLCFSENSGIFTI